jgi:hypothetical protein
MTVAQSRSANSAEQLLLKAVALSLVIHLAAYGGWKWGQTHAGWMRSVLPAWLQVVPHNLRSTVARQFPAVQHSQPPPLLYVDVDPALTAVEPPANAKYFSTADTLAANPEKKVPSDQPQISGTQDKVMQTVNTGARSVPSPTPPPVEKQTETAAKETAESKALPKQTYTPGDLANAKPAQKMQEKSGTSESDNGSAAVTEPAHQRPRTLAEARERQGAPGPKMRQEGGVNRVGLNSSLDVIRTTDAEYYRDFIDAVQQRWNYLCKGRESSVGKVVLEFNLHADGRISDMNMEYSDVTELLTLICQQAVLDPARYKAWSDRMRSELRDPLRITFTFYYGD